jgi:glycosyltransferase involved in cell wall biosynthesis
MKVLALSYLFPSPAHPEYGIFVYNRLKALQEFCEVKVIAPLQRYPFRGILRPELNRSLKIDLNENMRGIEVWYPEFSVIPRYLKFIDALSYYAAIKPLVKKMFQEGFTFDVIDTHWTYPDILSAYILSKRYNKPFIVTVRGKEALYLGERGGRKLILDWCLRRASAVVALSSELADLIVDVGVEPHKVRVILNGVDTGSFHQLDKIESRNRLSLPLDKKVLVAVGRLTEAKGHQNIIQALPSLAFQHDVELHIIGGINPESDYSLNLKEQVAKLGLHNVFIHNGMPHDQLLYWYNAADLFCLASHGEGCPNVVLEAMACGTPVVVSNVGAINDIVCDQSHGIIVDKSDVFVKSIQLALTKNWDRQAIAERMKKMSWQGCAKQVIELYNEVVANSGLLARNETIL